MCHDYRNGMQFHYPGKAVSLVPRPRGHSPVPKAIWERGVVLSLQAASPCVPPRGSSLLAHPPRSLPLSPPLRLARIARVLSVRSRRSPRALWTQVAMTASGILAGKSVVGQVRDVSHLPFKRRCISTVFH